MVSCVQGLMNAGWNRKPMSLLYHAPAVLNQPGTQILSCRYRSASRQSRAPGKIDIEGEAEGDLIAAIAQAVRRYKSERGIALNAPLDKIIIFTDDEIETGDIENATATRVEVRSDADVDADAINKDKGTMVDVKGTRIMII